MLTPGADVLMHSMPRPLPTVPGHRRWPSVPRSRLVLIAIDAKALAHSARPSTLAISSTLTPGADCVDAIDAKALATVPGHRRWPSVPRSRLVLIAIDAKALAHSLAMVPGHRVGHQPHAHAWC